jgi:hypothetical protein
MKVATRDSMVSTRHQKPWRALGESNPSCKIEKVDHSGPDQGLRPDWRLTFYGRFPWLFAGPCLTYSHPLQMIEGE